MKHHPEQGAHEIYMGNADQEAFDRSCWLSKRQGIHPYGRDGQPLQPSQHGGRLRPWFVLRSEIRQAIDYAPELNRADKIAAFQPMLDSGSAFR